MAESVLLGFGAAEKLRTLRAEVLLGLVDESEQATATTRALMALTVTDRRTLRVGRGDVTAETVTQVP
jgi:hypothetical protein